MKAWLSVGIAVFCAAFACAPAQAQVYSSPDPVPDPATRQYPAPPSVPGAPAGIVDLNWTPPAFSQLNAEAATRSSFSLDRNTLAIAAGLVPDADQETRQAIAKIDGVSVHMLRFGPAGIQDEPAVNEIRRAYHLRGWKHLVTNTAVLESSSPSAKDPPSPDPLHNGTTDLWLEMDGMNVRGAVALVESPKSLTLITLAGNISPVDLLHLRGHFGIPKFDGDQFKAASDR
jgi:hypothetical protein